MKHLLAVVAVFILVVSGNLPAQTTQPAASKPASTQPAYPLRDGNESVADYAKRAEIKDVRIELNLDANVTMKLTLIPAGKFVMGSPDSEKERRTDEGLQHEVTISRPFYMGIFEVTQEQYESLVGNNPSNFKGPTNPVETVTWDDAVEFCKKLSAKTGKTVELPTEAQWEYSCRAGTTTPFNTGQTISSDQANYNANSAYDNGTEGEYRQKTTSVGNFKPNDWGLFDMHGNVMEWCSDWYGLYPQKKETDPQGPVSGQTRVLRGGSWYVAPVYCRSAYRSGYVPVGRGDVIGFRVVVEVGQNQPKP